MCALSSFPRRCANSPALLAHRGSAQDSQTIENSREAFDAALSWAGTRGLESDVQVTRDGSGVISHDTHWHSSQGDIEIAAVTWDELCEYRLPNQEPPLGLAEFLQRYPDIYLNLDAKVPAALDVVISQLRGRKDLERFGLGSFSTRRVWKMARALGKAPGYLLGRGDIAHVYALNATGVTTSKTVGKLHWLVPHLVRNYRCALAVPETFHGITVVTPRFVAGAHLLGLPVYVWTVNDDAQYRRLSAMGVDAVYTDIVQTLSQIEK